MQSGLKTPRLFGSCIMQDLLGGYVMGIRKAENNNIISSSVRELEDNYYRLSKLTSKLLVDLKKTAQEAPDTRLGTIEYYIDGSIERFSKLKEFYLDNPDKPK